MNKSNFLPTIHKLRKIGILAITSLMLVAAAGCSAPSDPKSAVDDPKNDQAKQTVITVIGSTSVEKLMTMSADQYEAANGNVDVQIQAPGSSAGVKAANDGTANIGMSSRGLKDAELSWGLGEHTFAYDGIAVVVHPSNPVDSITNEQLQKIFAGEISNWSELGGKDAEIGLVLREAGSGTRGAFEEILKLDTVAEDKSVIADSTNAVTQNVAGKENAIGYVSMGSLNAATTKALQIDQVDCSAENILAGSYTLSRPFLLLTKGEVSPEVQAFLDYLLKDAQTLVNEEGFIPVK
jgi:phosphate transport system substrate-binding protein